MIENLAAGFEAAFSLTNLLFIAAGITLGIVIGAIPGLGSVTALAVLVPVTYYMSPIPAIAFLVGVNKGGTSGGAIPAILLNSPGTPEAAASALDGYPMAKRGEATRAMKYRALLVGHRRYDLGFSPDLPGRPLRRDCAGVRAARIHRRAAFRLRAACRHLRGFACQGADRDLRRCIPRDHRARSGGQHLAHDLQRGESL